MIYEFVNAHRGAVAIAGAAVLLVLVAVVYVECGNRPAPSTAETTLEQQVEQGKDRAAEHEAAAEEKETYAVEQVDKANAHRARRRAIHQQADERNAHIAAIPDADLGAALREQLVRTERALERARAAHAGGGSPNDGHAQ